MRRHNPAFIPRNHKVEEALEAAATSAGDFSVMERLLDVLATPYDHKRDLPLFSAPAGRPGLPHVLRHVVSDVFAIESPCQDIARGLCG